MQYGRLLDGFPLWFVVFVVLGVVVGFMSAWYWGLLVAVAPPCIVGAWIWATIRG